LCIAWLCIVIYLFSNGSAVFNDNIDSIMKRGIIHLIVKGITNECRHCVFVINNYRVIITTKLDKRIHNALKVEYGSS